MATKGKTTSTFSKAEKDAMKERASELKKGAGGDGVAEVAAKIAEMEPADRALAEGIHAIVTTVAPDLEVSTWYGFPAYKEKGKVVCFFKPAAKFKTRYATLGFSDKAKLDDTSMWATEFAVTELDDAAEARIAELVRTAVGA
jgi:uncharacterized protein YdhG (YjbR/CyaY superfamily)